ncbi:hypothetical protein NQ314_002057 [Rhamnusium bicolor]|uniref:Uncharacterized protein n=1 Tax=Rhamnusium bicolor TaxID=1586634 RepID=A0AAV8ZT76_9CUCU|nr:hypothetical protein NQ314_002057 [Rhamnusium bicolor]
MRTLKPIPVRRHGNRQTFVFKDLATTPYVFVRHDAPRATLEPTYDGPFKVLKRKERNFVIQWGDKEVNVTLDRLKPAHLLGDDFEDITPETIDSEVQVQDNSDSDVAVHKKRTTRSGRVVRFPERF